MHLIAGLTVRAGVGADLELLSQPRAELAVNEEDDGQKGAGGAHASSDGERVTAASARAAQPAARREPNLSIRPHG